MVAPFTGFGNGGGGTNCQSGPFQAAEERRDLGLLAFGRRLRFWLRRRWRRSVCSLTRLVRRGKDRIGGLLWQTVAAHRGCAAALGLVAHQRGHRGAARLEARHEDALDALLDEALDRAQRLHVLRGDERNGLAGEAGAAGAADAVYVVFG